MPLLPLVIAPWCPLKFTTSSLEVPLLPSSLPCCPALLFQKQIILYRPPTCQVYEHTYGVYTSGKLEMAAIS